MPIHSLKSLGKTTGFSTFLNNATKIQQDIPYETTTGKSIMMDRFLLCEELVTRCAKHVTESLTKVFIIYRYVRFKIPLNIVILPCTFFGESLILYAAVQIRKITISIFFSFFIESGTVLAVWSGSIRTCLSAALENRIK